MNELSPSSAIGQDLNKISELTGSAIERSALSTFAQQARVVKQYQEGLTLYLHPNGIFAIAPDIAIAEFGGKSKGIINLANNQKKIPATLLIAAQCFENGPLSLVTLRDALATAGIRELVALSSSSVYEDSGQHTAAGLFKSEFQFISAPDHALQASLQAVIDSARSEDAKAFYEKYKLVPKELAMVAQQVVYEQERAESLNNYSPHMSGVVDSAHPGHLEVALAFALGTAAVGGLASCFEQIERADPSRVHRTSRPAHAWQIIKRGSNGIARLKSYGDEDGRLGVGLSKVQQEAIHRDVLQREQQADGKRFEREFCIVDGEITYLQEREVKPVSKDFILPELGRYFEAIREFSVLETMAPDFIPPKPDGYSHFALSLCVSGQCIGVSRNVFFFKIPDAFEARFRSKAAAQVERLIAFNQSHPEGYILCFEIPTAVPGEAAFESCSFFPYRAFTNAVAIAGFDSSPFEWRVARKGLSHFAQYVRSDGIPLVTLKSSAFGEWFGLNQMRLNGEFFVPKGEEIVVAAEQFTGYGFFAQRAALAT